MYTELEYQLFKKRFHGTSNLTGIDFQIHYALNTALNLLLEEKPIEQITLEGIEDIDLKPFQTDNIYIQVKTSINSWHLSNLAQPIINFIFLNRTTQSPNQFNLVLNFEPRIAIKNLFSEEITVTDKEDIIKELLKQKEIKKDTISHEEIVDVVSNCKLKHISKLDLVEESKVKIIKYLNIHPNESETFLLSLLYKFIDWSIERKTINKADLLDFKLRFKENRERSVEFEAYGKGLIDRISWAKDKQSLDYFEGKKTRSGHIALGLDVKRTKWLKKIDELFSKTNICIIREASGQGKSTLAFRYAYDYWNPETTFIIKVVETAEQAEQISNYLKMLAELGLAISVVIDDISSDKKYFSSVLQNCANYPIQFLITSRNDDYYSFGSIGQVSLEFVIPFFDREEAKLIFQNLKRENRIHKEVISSDWAFERISSPKCLIEFIFLITQGQMLAERLSQQIKVMRSNNESSKIDFLRKAILADMCQTPLNINKLIINDTSGIDYQGVIQSTQNEFINIENGYIKGYHWVRSSHLINILHENFANPTITAIKTIHLIENDRLETFIGNLIELPDLDVNTLIDSFRFIQGNNEAKVYLSFIKGLFKIGEYLLFMKNKEIYDEGYKRFNEGVLFLFNSKFLATKSIDIFDIFGENKNFEEAKELSERFEADVRGFNLSRKFIEVNRNHFQDVKIELAGELLDWSYWLEIDLLELSEVEKLSKKTEIFQIDIDSFSLFSQAFFRKYPDKQLEWFEDNKKKIISKLEKDLKCSISLKNKTVSISYTEIKSDESFSDATVKRLNVIRSAIPFCESYNGNHAWIPMMTKLAKLKYQYAHDDSRKEIPAERLYFRSDIEKNKIFDDVVESFYQVKTWYEFDLCYFNLRKDISIYAENICNRLKGSKKDLGKLDAPYISDKILHSYKKMPIEIDALKKPFSDCRETFNSFNNFLLMKSNFVQNEFDEEAKKLIFINYNNFLIKLPKMQQFFEDKKPFSPRYFPFDELNQKESVLFNHLKELLKINIPNCKIYWELDTIIE